MFGMPTEDDGSRTDPLLGVALVGSIGYELDVEAVRRRPDAGRPGRRRRGEGEMANRGAHAVAERLGTKPVIFPSGHGGFLGGEYGQTGEPEAFAAKLRDVLSEGYPSEASTGARSLRPFTPEKSRAFRVIRISRCSSAVAAMSASGRRSELPRRMRPARSAMATLAGRSVIGSSRRRIRRSSVPLPANSSARVMADTWTSSAPASKRR